MKLSSSAAQSDTEIDYRGIVDSRVDIGVPGGAQLTALARTATLATPDPHVVDRLEDVIGRGAAITAVEITGAFAMTNRVIEATGQPVLESRRRRLRPILEQLEAADLPHSNLSIARGRTLADRITARLSRRLFRNANDV
jgi:hypothetical protein